MKLTPLSVTSGADLKNRISHLPSTPQWQATTIEFSGFTTKEPIELLWRDAFPCVRHLFGNPMYKGYMMTKPCKLYLDREKKWRYYSEGNSGERLWQMQV
jgi:hypothetical protein